MPRTIWSGAISFGLVSPLSYAGDESDALVRPYPFGVGTRLNRFAPDDAFAA
jgi:hypothetical protein